MLWELDEAQVPGFQIVRCVFPFDAAGDGEEGRDQNSLGNGDCRLRGRERGACQHTWCIQGQCQGPASLKLPGGGLFASESLFKGLTHAQSFPQFQLRVSNQDGRKLWDFIVVIVCLMYVSMFWWWKWTANKLAFILGFVAVSLWLVPKSRQCSKLCKSLKNAGFKSNNIHFLPSSYLQLIKMSPSRSLAHLCVNSLKMKPFWCAGH